MIYERHDQIKSNYEKLINLQMEAIFEESAKMQKLFDKNKDKNIGFESDLEIEIPKDLTFGENFMLELEKRKVRNNILSNKFMVEMNELRSLSPWMTNLRMFNESFQKTDIFDRRIYPESSKYYSNPFISSIILFILSLSLFLVFIFIRYKKKLNF